VSRKIKPAPHRVIKPNSPESRCRYKKQLAEVAAEKDALIAEGRKLIKPIRAQRKQLADVFIALRTAREQSGLTLTEFAERSGIARETIYRLEQQIHANPTIETIQRYASALDLSVNVSLIPAKG